MASMAETERHEILIPLVRRIVTARELHMAIDRLCYRAGARIAKDGTVRFSTDREECGDLRELHDESQQLPPALAEQG